MSLVSKSQNSTIIAMGKKRGPEPLSPDSRPPKHVRVASSDDSRLLDQKYPITTPSARVLGYRDFNSLPLQVSSSAQPLLPQIADTQLLKQVFTHSSTIDSKYKSSGTNDLDYERLEFLGDAYVQCIATRIIFSRIAKPVVGKQASLRESLVKNETLASFSYRYGFSERLKIGEKLKRSMSKLHWDKVVADVFEAYVAAIILEDPENGFTKAEDWLTKLWTPMILQSNLVSIEKNTKDIISRRLQGKDVKLKYKEDKPVEIDNGGKQRHTISLFITGWGYKDRWLGRGVGCGKTEAGMLAAYDALEHNPTLICEIEESKRHLEEARKDESLKK